MGRHTKNKLMPINIEQEKIGKQLSKIRKIRGLTQKQLADKIGVSRSTIADYEHGKNRIYDLMILRIAIALNVTPNDILCFNKENKIDLNPSLRLMKRIQKIVKLPIAQQKALLRTLDLALKTSNQA
jgi:transcriptional regulator with XRE-family HTH domain